MSGNATFKQIPIVVQTAGRDSLAKTRIAVRVLSFAILLLIPLTGIFRIDVSSGFVVLGRQIWFSDFFIVFGLWLSVACCLIMLYSTMGTVFCGWVCPQNTFSTWANKITLQLLGKRAVINWGDEAKVAQVSTTKNNSRNWLLLASKLVGASMMLAIVPMLYFLPPGAVWSFVTFQPDARFTASLYWIYTVFTLVALANITVMRHYVCRYMCIYRMWQYLFKTRDTLHIEYDSANAAKCEKCNYCETTCPVAIDPRNTINYDSCTNCGECITACDSLHKKHNKPGLLQFRFGSRKGKQSGNNRMELITLLGRAGWVLPVFVFAAGLLTWGLVTYQPYHLSVYQTGAIVAGTEHSYRINVANKSYGPATVHLQVEGLPEGAYRLERDSIDFATAGRGDVVLHLVLSALPSGLHAVVVRASSGDGWQDSFKIQHLVERVEEHG